MQEDHTSVVQTIIADACTTIRAIRMLYADLDTKQSTLRSLKVEDVTAWKTKLTALSVLGFGFPPLRSLSPGVRMRAFLYPLDPKSQQTTRQSLVQERAPIASLTLEDLLILEHATYGQCLFKMENCEGWKCCAVDGGTEAEWGHDQAPDRAAADREAGKRCAGRYRNLQPKIVGGAVVRTTEKTIVQDKFGIATTVLTELIAEMDRIEFFIAHYNTFARGIGTEVPVGSKRMRTDDREVGSSGVGLNVMETAEDDLFKEQRYRLERDHAVRLLRGCEEALSVAEEEINALRSQASRNAISDTYIDRYGNINSKCDGVGEGSFGEVVRIRSHCAKFQMIRMKRLAKTLKSSTDDNLTIPAFVAEYADAGVEAYHEAIVSEVLSHCTAKDGKVGVVMSRPLTMPIGIEMPHANLDGRMLGVHLSQSKYVSTYITDVCSHILTRGGQSSAIRSCTSQFSVAGNILNLDYPSDQYKILHQKSALLRHLDALRAPPDLKVGMVNLGCIWDSNNFRSIMCCVGMRVRQLSGVSEPEGSLSCEDVEKHRMFSLLEALRQVANGFKFLRGQQLVQCDPSAANMFIYPSKAVSEPGESHPPFFEIVQGDLGGIRELGAEQYHPGGVGTPSNPDNKDMRNGPLLSKMSREIRRATPSVITPEQAHACVSETPFTATEKTVANSFGAVTEELVRSFYGPLMSIGERDYWPHRKLDDKVYAERFSAHFKSTLIDWKVKEYDVLRLLQWKSRTAGKKVNKRKLCHVLTNNACEYYSRLRGKKKGQLDEQSEARFAQVMRRIDTVDLNEVAPPNSDEHSSSIHQLLLSLRRQQQFVPLMDFIGTNLRVEAMLGTGFDASPEEALCRRTRITCGKAEEIHKAMNGHLNPLAFVEIMVGGFLSAEQCAIAGTELKELARTVSSHIRILHEVIELISRCSILTEDDRPSPDLCAKLIQQLRDKLE